MSDVLNPIAEIDRIDSGEVKTPDEAEPLKGKTTFFCPDYDCKDKERRLILKKSNRGKNFFSHIPGFEHDIRPETLLHKLAIKWFENKTEFEIPAVLSSGKKIKKQILKLDPLKTVLEYSRLKTIIPDVKLCSPDNFDFAIEIFVTNDISDTKKKIISEFGLPTIRVDLSKFYNQHSVECRMNKLFVEDNLQSLLTDCNLKTWVVNPRLELTPSLQIEATPIPAAAKPGCMVMLTFIGVVWLLIKFMTN